MKNEEIKELRIKIPVVPWSLDEEHGVIYNLFYRIDKLGDKVGVVLKAVRIMKNPLIYIQDYLKLLKERVVIYELKDGTKLRIRTGIDRNVFNEIYLREEYMPKGFEIRKDDVVMDIGGHIGLFSVKCAKKASNGKVYSFEPESENFNLFEENIKLNGLKNVFVNNVAVASKKGECDFFVSDGKNRGQHSLLSFEGGRKQRVRKISFNDFIYKNKIEKIAFLKMDCEGNEYDILYNCPQRIFDKMRKLAIEYHYLDRERNEDKLMEFLKSKRFEIVGINREKGRGIIYARKINFS